MPAIDLNHLSKECEKLQLLVTDPPAFRRRILDLFEFYADRTKRSSTSLQYSTTVRSYHVPRPVLRAVREKLEQALSRNPECTKAVAEELWQTGYREPQLLVCPIINGGTIEDFLHQVERYATETDDLVVLTELARQTYYRFQEIEDGEFHPIITDWIQSGKDRMQLLAFLVMEAAVGDPSFRELPIVFQFLRSIDLIDRSIVRRTFHDLIKALTQRSASETARFLLDELHVQSALDRHVIQSLLDEFPLRERRRLERALST